MRTIKNFLLFAISFIAIVSLTPSCEEVPPYIIDFTPPDTSTMPPDTTVVTADIDSIRTDSTFVAPAPAPQQRIVLMEEFSGVRCVQCPAGHVVTKEILDAHPGRVVAATIHAGPAELTARYPSSAEDYRIDEGPVLFNIMEGGSGLPIAGLDRVLFNGEQFIGISQKEQWASKVVLEMAKATPVNIYLYHDYNATTRQLDVYVQMRYTEAVEVAHHLSIHLTESGIVDRQLTPASSAPQPDYVHDHVLRTMMTSASGDLIIPEKVEGRVVVKSYSMILPDHWVPEEMEIIAFVHESIGKVVHQAAGIYVAK